MVINSFLYKNSIPQIPANWIWYQNKPHDYSANDSNDAIKICECIAEIYQGNDRQHNDNIKYEDCILHPVFHEM